ncbi:26S proteasome regulatory subunit rpn11 [Tolypocladium paradoxum]|uniref:26S proteasome regulatory subunit rpn11 n=1 Tax=Tolypocladium paradoxum TaxID=94208 RepID=A0A2S4KNB5_9HYPO|nr:26S proteasome regulatory subunit rpn11 [Tolypocladium paradoxum]
MSLRNFFRSVFGGLSCSSGRDDGDDRRQARLSRRRSTPPRLALNLSEDPEYWSKWTAESMSGIAAANDRHRSSVRQAGPVPPARCSSAAVRGSYTPTTRARNSNASALPQAGWNSRVARPAARETPRGQVPARTQPRARQSTYTRPSSQVAAKQTVQRVTFENDKRQSTVNNRQSTVSNRQPVVNHRRPVANNRQPVVHNRQPAVNHRQPAVNNRPKAQAPKPLNQRALIRPSSHPTQRVSPAQATQITPKPRASSHHGRKPQATTPMKPMAQTKVPNKLMSRPSSSVAETSSQAASKPPSRPSSEATLNLQRQPQQQHHSSTSKRSARASPTFETMTRSAVCEVVDAIGKIFAHIPYAVCGHAAMVYYGNTLHEPDHISIVCPIASLDAVIGWAQTRALAVCARFPKAFTYTTADGVERCVRVLGYAEFDRLRRVRLGPSLASVLTLPGLADSMACDYVKALRDGDRRGTVQRARDINWLLRRIVEVGGEEQRLTVEQAGYFGRLDFLEPFSLAHERAMPLMERAGLDLMSIPGFNPPAPIVPAPIVPAVPEPRRASEVRVRAKRPRLATHADGPVAGTVTAVQGRRPPGRGHRRREAVVVPGPRGAPQARRIIGFSQLAQFVRAAVRFQLMGDIFRTKQARSACPPLVINRTKTSARGSADTHHKPATALKGTASRIPRYASGGEALPRTSHGSSTASTRRSVDARSSRKREARAWDDEMDLVLGENIVLCDSANDGSWGWINGG